MPIPRKRTHSLDSVASQDSIGSLNSIASHDTVISQDSLTSLMWVGSTLTSNAEGVSILDDDQTAEVVNLTLLLDKDELAWIDLLDGFAPDSVSADHEVSATAALQQCCAQVKQDKTVLLGSPSGEKTKTKPNLKRKASPPAKRKAKAAHAIPPKAVKPTRLLDVVEIDLRMFIPANPRCPYKCKGTCLVGLFQGREVAVAPDGTKGRPSQVAHACSGSNNWREIKSKKPEEYNLVRFNKSGGLRDFDELAEYLAPGLFVPRGWYGTKAELAKCAAAGR
jgi:hypothetical protein